LNFFHELGLAIVDRWCRADFDQAAFSDIAADVLRERPPSAHVDPFDVVRWVHETPVLVPQADIDSKFGQPPITVFRTEGFSIDVLFWVDGTTAIHQHGFSGAFHVMQGSSLQSTYRYARTRRYSEQLLSGQLDLVGVELLVRGDVRPILAGAGLVHALFHLDRPSVSVVVRTPSDAFAGPQYTYSRSGLAWDPFAKSEAAVRKSQTLDLLHTLEHPEFERLARALVQRADAFLAFRILTRLAKRFESQDKYAAFLESVRPSHADLLGPLKAYAEEERRDEYIIARRRLAKQPEHRFLLALLLNLPARGPIFDVIRRAFPGPEPAATVLRWLRELAKIDAINAWVTDVSTGSARAEAPQISDVGLDERALEVARCLLEGATDDAVVDRLRGAQSRADVLATCESLRGSSLLGPLFLA
jgi:hypothetical protein